MPPRRSSLRRRSYSQSTNHNAVVSRLAQQDEISWYKKPNLRLLYLLMFPTCLGVEVTSGFDSSMLNALQAVPSWLEYFHYPRSGSLGLMSAMYSLGGLASIPFVPFITDKFGRRYSIFIGSVFMVIGAILQGAALDFAMFIIARFILGFGVVFAIVAASSLVGELSYPKERAIMGSLFNTSYIVGSISAAGVAFGTFTMSGNWGWRIPSLLQAVPSILQLCFIWSLPESPRWLISKGKWEEAYAILVKYHAEGDEHSEFAKAEYTQIEQTLREELKNAYMSWKDLLSTMGMRKRVIIASFLGLSTKFCGYGLIIGSVGLQVLSFSNIGIHDNRTKHIINLTKTAWNLVNATFLSLVVPRYSRRRMFLACAVFLLVIMIAWTVASAEYAAAHSLVSSQVVLCLIFLYSPVYNVGFTSLTYAFLVELFPFHIRARGITIFQWWNRTAAFVTQFVDPIGIDIAGWRYYLVYCAWNALQVLFIYIMFPETSGRTLEELSFLYERDQGQVRSNAEAEPLLRGSRDL